MVGGKNIPNFESSPPDWIQRMWETNSSGYKFLGHLSLLDLGNQSKFISPHFIFGCNFSIRRLVLERTGGFHPDGMPKELIKYRGDGESYISEYVENHGHIALYHPDASVYHWVPNSRMTIQYFNDWAYNQGISDSYTEIRKSSGLLVKSNYQQKINDENLYRKIKALLGKFRNQSVDAKLMKIQMQVDDARKAGFIFHQNEVCENDNLLKWVLCSDYFSCDLYSNQ